jgi:hypothetical protein
MFFYRMFRQNHLIFSGKKTEAMRRKSVASDASQRQKETRGARYSPLNPLTTTYA